MRAFDRDLIRGGHYGQRTRVPREKAEHMAAPTQPCSVKILLANPEPSTHGPSAKWLQPPGCPLSEARRTRFADVEFFAFLTPERTSSRAVPPGLLAFADEVIE